MFKFEKNKNKSELAGEEIVIKIKEILRKTIGNKTDRLEQETNRKIDELLSELESKGYNLEIDKSEIIKNALELLSQETVLDSVLETEYLDLLAKEIADQVNLGENFYETLGKIGNRLKRKGIKIDSEKLKEKAEKETN